MDVKLWTGDGSSTRAITGLEFNPDFVWIKNRNQAGIYHNLFDKVRDSGKTLFSNTTDSEVTNSAYGYLSSFDSNGFSLSAGGSGSDNVNVNSWTYAAWCWDAGTSTVSNTQGSITSQVRANATAGFSVVKYTTVGSTNSTVGHGLGVAPRLLIVRYINQASGWFTYHADAGAGNYLQLQTTGAASALSSLWNNTTPTSTVFSIGTAWTSSVDTIAYCFAPVVGYSNAFSFVGNGSTDGPAVWLGFRPRFVILKASSSTSHWHMMDSARQTYNQMNTNLFANLSNAELSDPDFQIDFLSNGFKLRTSGPSMNGSGVTYIGYAWAEAPFNYSRAR
jgi:hypothetical protein